MALSTNFTITVQVGKDNPKEITLQASDLASVVTNGWRFSLPSNSTTTVGALKDVIGWINQGLSAANIPAANLVPDTVPATWPDTIKNIFTGVLNATVTINRFTIDQKPKGADGNFPAMEYSLDVSARATPGPIDLIAGVFKVAGAGFTVTKTNA